MKLEVYKGNITIDKASLETKELKKLSSLQDLLYVFFLCDLSEENPLKDVAYNHKEHEARLCAYGDTAYVSPDQELIDAAVKTYPISEQQKDIFTYNKKMDQFGVMLANTEPKILRNVNENTDVITFSTNVSIINGILKDVTKIIQAKASLVSMYIDGSVPNHLRGGLSPLTKGKIKINDNL